MKSLTSSSSSAMSIANTESTFRDSFHAGRPMHPHITDVFSKLDEARDELSAAVETVPESLRSERPADNRWSVAEVLEHVALVEQRFAGVIVDAIAKARAAGLGPEAGARAPFPEHVSGPLLDRRDRRDAPEAVQPTGTLDPVAAWAAFERSRDRLRAVVSDADGLALSQVVADHHRWGPLDVYHWIELAAGHQRRHADQVREIAAQLRRARQP